MIIYNRHNGTIHTTLIIIDTTVVNTNIHIIQFTWLVILGGSVAD